MYKKLKIFMTIMFFVLFGLTQYFVLFPSMDNMIHDNVMVSGRNVMDNIIIVGIDERSINEIGSWPWPRFFMAEAITRLTEMGAAAIGINVLYDTTGAVPEYDEALLNAAMGTDRLVLGGMGILSPFQDASGILEIEYYVLPFDELGEIVTVGFLNAIPDESDGVMRRSVTSLRFGDITVHSFPFEVYRTFSHAMGRNVTEDIPLDRDGQFPIRYVGGPQSFNAVSLWGVINEHYPSAMFRDAIVLIGPYAQGIGEGGFTTPIERGIATHGVEIYANIIQNFLEGVFIVDAPWWLNLAVLALSGLVIILIFQYLKPQTALIATILLVAALLAGARVAYDNFHTIIRVGDTILFLGICYLSNLILSILAAQNDRQQIKDIFGRFVAPEVVNEIISGGVDIQLGGVVKEITALFVDIRGFTAFSEANPPEKVVSMVNRYLELTSTAIQENNGTIDKFIGDATMALFNAPNNVPNHALCAVNAAWAMKKGAAALQKEILKEYGVDLQFGIGINTGVAVVGNMGSDFRMDYTAIGDAINTAARLESNAGKGQIIISDATYQLVKQYVEVEELGTVNFKNKSVGVLIYAVENVENQGGLQ
ncbi:MAG: adenylate/guanylate cyclase domain-containing protein [Defluviitaleaceae bacterium]|nr:adenylate/guanylate cyclase domain-containing protein [Defluviitaleaceae bacterium]